MSLHPLPTPAPTEPIGPHPVDRMAAIKAQIGELEREYAELRELVVSGEVEPEGERWIADVQVRERRSIRVGVAERILSADLFSALVQINTQTFVALVRKASNKPPRKAKRQWRRGRR